MKESLRLKKRVPEDPVLIGVKLSIYSQTDSLSSETLEELEHVIVTSVRNLLRSTTKKEPDCETISNLTTYSPEFLSETRYLVKVNRSNPKSSQ
jgi:hypothetical protein